MTVLLMRLTGPMQSWGIQSRFTHRDSSREPSKSGVVGILCAACGYGRQDVTRIEELAMLSMGVRVDREGTLERDFHTAGGGDWPGRSRYGVWKARGSPGDTLVSHRYYLAGADFLVALEGPHDLLMDLQNALANPVWPLYLGRKALVPGVPVWIKDGIREGSLIHALSTYPWVRRSETRNTERLRLVLECSADEGQPRLDVPVSFDPADRSFRLRYVKNAWLDVADIPVVLEG